MFRNLLGFGEMLSHWRQRERQKTLQMQGLRLGPARFPPACRPIHFEKPDDAAPHPDACSYDSRESAEAQFPLRKELEIAQQQVHQKPGPDLPLDRVLVEPDEVTELACLFEPFEEQLDCPSRSVEFGHGPCGPVAVVREEGHSPHLPSYLDHRRVATRGGESCDLRRAPDGRAARMAGVQRHRRGGVGDAGDGTDQSAVRRLGGGRRPSAVAVPHVRHPAQRGDLAGRSLHGRGVAGAQGGDRPQAFGGAGVHGRSPCGAEGVGGCERRG